MKTPDEIKKSAEICGKEWCWMECPYFTEKECVMNLLSDALAYIEQLESRAEPKNRVLTPEEATGSDEPVWLEAMSRVFIADVCVAPDARMAQIQTIGKASCEYLPLCDYGVLWRCWLRKPTEAERRGTSWAGDSHE
jgi:hypothetical protein|nr:MAG TPA: hypothetical protein [Caudoviricetes sp.]